MQDYPRAILGAGKQAEHILFLLEWMGLPWTECFLFDDAFRERATGARGLAIKGTLRDGIEHCRQQRPPAFVALGTKFSALRYAVFQKASSLGVHLVSLIHPSCSIAPTARIGRNVLMMPGCVIGPGSQIGSLCCFFSNVTIEHDCKIGENVVMGPGATLSGFVQIGAHSFLGTGVVCSPELTVGERTLIGSGAVAVSNLPAGSVCFGVPALVKRQVKAGDDVPTREQMLEHCPETFG